MNMVLMVVYLVLALVLVGIVLLQQGKGSSMSPGLGSASEIFGPAGQGNFLTHTTAVLAILFMLFNLLIAVNASSLLDDQSDAVLDIPLPEETVEVPVLDIGLPELDAVETQPQQDEEGRNK